MARVPGPSTYDVVAGEAAGAQGGSILTHVAQKGFCVVNLKLSPDLLVEAVGDAKRLNFAPPPREIVEGLLGEEGCSGVCHLGRDVASSLAKVDGLLDSVSQALLPLAAGWLDLTVDSRSPGIVAVAGISGDHPPLTDAACDLWMGRFMRARLMMILFLGPAPGILELQPFRHEDAPACEIPTEAGMLVVLRFDALTHRFMTSKRSFSLSLFLSEERLHANESIKKSEKHPLVVNELVDFAMKRLEELKSQEINNERGVILLDPDFPPSWRSMMSHMYHRSSDICARSMACKYPTTWEPAAWWQGLQAGIDFAREIPYRRFGYEDMYDPDVEAHKRWKCCAKHGVFIEGEDLFDPKIFTISMVEAKYMDPCQRVILETSYEALVGAGKTRKTLMRSKVGVYISCAASEFSFIPQDMSSGFGGTSAACSITANRISFVLGIQGPNVAIDCGAAGALVGLWQGIDTIRYRTEYYDMNHTSLVGGVALALAPQPFVMQGGAGWLSPQGRCFTFDNSASGYVKGEGVGAIVNSPYAETIDGEDIVNKDDPFLGMISAVRCSHSGKGATLSAPNGPQEMEVMEYCLRQAGIHQSDMDNTDPHGQGAFMSDAVEMSTLKGGLRNEQGEKPLSVSTVKSQSGFMMETCGMSQLMKVLSMQRFSVQTPGIHLHQLNPHAELDDSLMFITEPITNEYDSSYGSVASRGLGGTVGFAILWSIVDVGKVTGRTQVLRESVAFWPAGGGDLDDEMRPKRVYTIVGSWSGWAKSEPMQPEGHGVYGFTITIGPNRFEHFQVWLDGDGAKVLHPGEPGAPKGSSVFGPDTSESSGSWLIDASARLVPAKDCLALGDGSGQELPLLVPDDIAKDAGIPGDQYRVRLRVNGKWRTVDWEKIADGVCPEEDIFPDGGRYYLTGSFCEWSMTEMFSTGEYVYSTQLTCLREVNEFQILRNMDESQSFFPSDDQADFSSDVVGPCAGLGNFSWCIVAEIGDVFNVTFSRKIMRGSDQEPCIDDRRVKWTKVSNTSPDGSYSIVVSSDNFHKPCEMTRTGTTVFEHVITMAGRPVNFQILARGSWNRVVYPTVHNAGSGRKHGIEGPDEGGGHSWRIGTDSRETVKVGARYRVRLFVDMADVWSPVLVTWTLQDESDLC